MFHKICKPSILVFLKYKTGKYMHFGKHTIYSIEYYGQEKLVLMQSTSIHSV